MASRIPKDPAIRQRRNKTSTAATLPASEKRKAPMPSLPNHPSSPFVKGVDADGNVTEQANIVEWHPLTKAWWRDAWKSPMATEFLKADYHGLVRLAVLIDQFWTDSNPKLAGEIRQEQQAYGLSPLSRRTLQWTISKTEEATKRHPAKPPSPSQKDDDPRKILEFPA